MTHLRQIMLEELRRRNFADSTIRTYIRTVEQFSRYFHCPPDRLGPEHIRHYQAMLLAEKLSANTVGQRLAALRFFYIRVLKRSWSITETPYPKGVFRLPLVLSQEEVARLINAADSSFHRILLMTLYATGVRRAELARLKVSDIDSQRMVIHIRVARDARTATSCSAPSCSSTCASTGVACAASLPTGSFPAGAGTPAGSPSPPRPSGMPAIRPRGAPAWPQARPSPHPAALFRHPPARSRRRPAHHSVAARAS